MRPRTHLLASAALGLALYPLQPVKAAVVAIAGTIIDFDHLILYGLQTGDWSVVGALRYNRYRHHGEGPGDTRPRYGSLRSLLHQPWLLLPPLWLLALARPWLRPVAFGLSLHLLLDQYDSPLRLVARIRAGGRCFVCRRDGRSVSVHRFRWNGSRRYIVLCKACTELTARHGHLPTWYTSQ